MNRTSLNIHSILFAILGLAGIPAALAADRVCELITPSEATAAVGAAIPAGVASPGESGDHLCRYVASGQGMVAITLAEAHGREKFEKAKAKIQSDPALTPEIIPGLGDQAVFANISRSISELLVVKGDKSIAIALSGRTVDASKEALKELAKKALSRM